MTINLKRLYHQILLNLQLKWKLKAIVVVISLVVVIFHYLNKDFSFFNLITTMLSGRSLVSNSYTTEVHKFHFSWFPIFLIMVSTIITSLIFTEYSEKTSRTFHLSLPSTIIEKWLAKVLIAVIICPLALTVLYQIFISVSNLWPSVDEYHQVSTHILDPVMRANIPMVMLLQGVIVLFALWFRKFSFLKTILAVILIIISYNSIVIVSTILFDGSNELMSDTSIQHLTSVNDFLSSTNRITQVKNIGFRDIFLSSNLRLAITSSFCLLLSFLKFKEMQS